MADPEDVPDMPGHLRVTLIGDDQEGCSVFILADRVTELLEGVAELSFRGRRVAEAEADAAWWAELRTMAFDMARVKGETPNFAAGMLGAWCAMRGPGGDDTRRRLSAILGRAGKAALLLRRNRATGAVVTMVEETLDAGSLELAERLVAADLPEGVVTVVSVPDDGPGPVEH